MTCIVTSPQKHLVQGSSLFNWDALILLLTCNKEKRKPAVQVDLCLRVKMVKD